MKISGWECYTLLETNKALAAHTIDFYTCFFNYHKQYSSNFQMEEYLGNLIAYSSALFLRKQDKPLCSIYDLHPNFSIWVGV